MSSKDVLGPEPSYSKVGTTEPQNSHDMQLANRNPHLAVPSHSRPRRTSLDSAFSGSDISELSFASTELGNIHHEGLIRTLNNVSATIASLPGPHTWRTTVAEFWTANYGAFLVLVSQLFGCAMNIATRTLETPGPHGEPMHPFQILFARQSITVLITTIYALCSKSVPHFPLGPPGKVRLLLICRGLFGFLGVFGLYFSLLYLTISESTILTFLGPIGACYAFSLLIPGETFSKQQQIASFVSLLGVIFIARPFSLLSSHDETLPQNAQMANSTASADEPVHPTTSQHIQAVMLAMLGVVGAIGALTSIRAIGTRAHALLSVNYFSAWCTIVSLLALICIPSVKFRLPGNAAEWGFLSILGFAGFFMQLLLTKGMAYGGRSGAEKQENGDIEMQARQDDGTGNARRQIPAKQIKGSGAKATSMLYTQMLFALISDKVVFGITPGVWSWLGSGLILFGAIWVAAEGGKGRSEENVKDVVASEAISKINGQQEEEVGLLADHEEIVPDAESIQDGSRSKHESNVGL